MSRPRTSQQPQLLPADSRWRWRLTEPGWRLLPLRAFLGITFTYAGLQKLANPAYLDSKSPTSVAHQLLLLRHSSPIGPLLGLSTHAPTAVGLLIAFAELAVGLGTLLGLLPRIAALGGAVLALSFFLTVSWATTPYYYGADIVFVFAWTVLAAFGSGGTLSLDHWLRDRARRGAGLAPEAAAVAVPVPRLRSLCGREAKCGLAPDGVCGRPAGCPVFAPVVKVSAAKADEVSRRSVVLHAAAAGTTAALALAVGGITAAAGRALRGHRGTSAAGGGGSGTTSPTATAPAGPSAPASGGSTPAGPSSSAAKGTAIASAASIPVGQAQSFTNPADGNPAWVVHTAASTFVAFSAVCTHAGCPVSYDPSTVEFVCPCHGGTYDARTGKVLQGPPPAPLPALPVTVTGGQVRVG